MLKSENISESLKKLPQISHQCRYLPFQWEMRAKRWFHSMRWDGESKGCWERTEIWEMVTAIEEATRRENAPAREETMWEEAENIRGNGWVFILWEKLGLSQESDWGKEFFVMRSIGSTPITNKRLTHVQMLQY